jgi:Asp-tRNA(Asn)/Glu-tRNA(Gln) amidotransferase C subunit
VPAPHVPIERLAELARIALSEDERAHPFDASLRLRADEVTEGDQSELFLAQAPESQGGYFLVPRVLE